MNDLLASPPAVPPRPYAAAASLWFEDLRLGDEFLSRDYEVTSQEIVAFARRFDPQLFHLDPDGARGTFFAGLAASGWHTASITMRLVAESVPLAWGIIGAGTDSLHWPRPTRPGDCLRVRTRVESKRPLRSRPALGLVTMKCSTIDQRDEPVQVLVPKLLVPLRVRGEGEPQA